VDEGWTLGELVGRVGEALAAADVKAPNGRVTGLPDARVIRWYATIGLVDRPLGARGRTALYGPRHLLQLVAVKRLQAQGRTLAEIQFELAGATEDTLRRVAALPEPSSAAKTGDARFWAKPPTVAPTPAIAPPAPATTPAVPATAAAVPATTAAEPAVYGLTLGGGALLLVPSAAAGQHAEAIRAAARPLLDLLAANGLLEA
jgi:hypothetical protein